MISISSNAVSNNMPLFQNTYLLLWRLIGSTYSTMDELQDVQLTEIKPLLNDKVMLAAALSSQVYLRWFCVWQGALDARICRQIEVPWILKPSKFLPSLVIYHHLLFWILRDRQTITIQVILESWPNSMLCLYWGFAEAGQQLERWSHSWFGLAVEPLINFSFLEKCCIVFCFLFDWFWVVVV